MWNYKRFYIAKVILSKKMSAKKNESSNCTEVQRCRKKKCMAPAQGWTFRTNGIE